MSCVAQLRAPGRTALAGMALVMLAIAGAAWATNGDPDLRLYFSAAELEAFHAFRRPRWIRAIADVAVEAALFALLLGGLSARLWAASVRGQERLAGRASSLPGAGALSAPLDRLWGDRTWAAALLFAAAVFLLGLAAQLPSALLFDWLQPRLHGLSSQSLGRFLSTLAIDALVEAAGLTALAFGLWGLMRRTRRWWLLLGLPCGVLVALSGAADPARISLHYQTAPLPPGPQRAAVEGVLARAGLQAEEILVIDARRDTNMLDAFVSGEGPTRRIFLFDTLVEALPPAELAGVIAHELGHLGEHRLRNALIAGAAMPLLLALLAGFLSLLAGTGRCGFRDPREPAALPAALLFGWLVATLATPPSLAWGRRLELEADRAALELLRDPASLRSALVRLARTNQADPAPPWPVVLLLYAHPPVAERLGAVEAWARAQRFALPPPTPALFADHLEAAPPR